MNELTTTIKSVRRVGQKAGKKPKAFFAVRGAWGRGRARQSNCDSNLSPLFVGGFPRSWTDFVKSMTERFRGQAWGWLPSLPALLLTTDISCSKKHSYSRLCLAACCIFLMLRLLQCLCSFACCSSYLCKAWLCESVLIEPASSGFYLPVASKLFMIDLPGLSAI